ncbi:MAG: hypothetical protein MUP98_03505 [Candidatus Aminicenantes bacterium]|nr:hypothetical protein [Candidatus Aminicenantes bacterium]
MKKQKTQLLVLILIIFMIQAFSQANRSLSEDQDDLDEILKKCAEYCERLSNSVLNFVCIEKITESLYPQRTTNVYMYDYQIIRKDNKISDRRILLRENGKEKHIEDAQLKTKRYKHHNILFGPIGLLAELWHPHYNYKILQRRMFKGDKVVVIEATPKNSEATQNLYGKVWVREADYSIVKIEWDQNSLRDFYLLENDARRFGAKPVVEFYAEYAFEKNDIRVPNKYVIVENYYRYNRKNFTRCKIITSYKDYKFFTVESAVKY